MNLSFCFIVIFIPVDICHAQQWRPRSAHTPILFCSSLSTMSIHISARSFLLLHSGAQVKAVLGILSFSIRNKRSNRCISSRIIAIIVKFYRIFETPESSSFRDCCRWISESCKKRRQLHKREKRIVDRWFQRDTTRIKKKQTATHILCI